MDGSPVSLDCTFLIPEIWWWKPFQVHSVLLLTAQGKWACSGCSCVCSVSNSLSHFPNTLHWSHFSRTLSRPTVPVLLPPQGMEVEQGHHPGFIYYPAAESHQAMLWACCMTLSRSLHPSEAHKPVFGPDGGAHSLASEY